MGIDLRGCVSVILTPPPCSLTQSHSQPTSLQSHSVSFPATSLQSHSLIPAHPPAVSLSLIPAHLSSVLLCSANNSSILKTQHLTTATGQLPWCRKQKNRTTTRHFLYFKQCIHLIVAKKKKSYCLQLPKVIF